MSHQQESGPIVFFDGECNLCNSSVQFIIRHDKKKQFRFAPLQSAAATQLRAHFGAHMPNSIVLFYQGRYYTRSTAALKVARLLSGAWRALYALIVVPPLLRNAAYDLIARNRYKWFGKRDTCMIPTPELQNRFLK